MSTAGDGNVIKRGAAGHSSSDARPAGVIKRPVVEARAEARRILHEAEAESRRVAEEAERSSRELREAAYRDGHEAALAEVHALLMEAQARRDAALADAERDLLRLAVKLAEKIIGREIERDGATLADMVANALRHARQNESLTVRVNPADFAAVREHRARLDPSGRARFLDLVADPHVRHGGCVIEGESGAVDAQLDTQLRVLERALLARAAADGEA